MTYNRTIGGLICLAICLFHANTFAVDPTDEPVEISAIADKQTIVFSTSKRNSIAVTDALFTVEDEPSSLANVHGIYFATGDFSGKILTLNNDNIDYSGDVDYLISARTSQPRFEISPADQENPAVYVYTSAAAINLGCAHGTATTEGDVTTINPFTIQLDNTGGTKVYRLSAEALPVPAGELTADDLEEQTGIIAALKNGIRSIPGVTEEHRTQLAGELSNGDLITLLGEIKSDLSENGHRGAVVVLDGLVHAASVQARYNAKYSEYTNDDMQYKHTAAVGVPNVYLTNNSSTYDGSNFAFGPQGAQVEFTAASNGPSACSTVFGVGSAFVVDGNLSSISNIIFDNWTIGNFGNNIRLSSSASICSIFGIGLAGGNSRFTNWNIGNFGDNAILTAATTSYSNSFATLFGPANITNNGDNNFYDWRIGQFGDNAILTAEATGYSNSCATLFGPALITNNGDNNFYDWLIGQFAGEATLTATATSWATLFGPALIANGGNNNFYGWQIGAVTNGNMGTAFGKTARLTATANSCATLFGPANINASGDNKFSDWRIGQFAGEATLTATSGSWATLFGPANINNGGGNDFSGWQIGAVTGRDMGTAFGGNATLRATANTSSFYSSNSWATLFGPANINNGVGNDFSGWQIGRFAGEAELATEATSSSSFSSSNSWATLFGPANINTGGSNDFSGWQIGAMTDGNMGTAFAGIATLRATANTSGSSSSNSWATLFGPANINNSNLTTNTINKFSHWRIGRFAGEAELATEATSSSSFSSSNSCATLFGPANINTGGSNDFSGWQIGEVTGGNMGTAFGKTATLKATAISSNSSTWATLFGPAFLLNESTNYFSHWWIGQFAGEANLEATATGSSNSWASVFGPVYIENGSGGNDCSGWQIGAMTDGNMGTAFAGIATLRATATGSSNSWASVFGPAYLPNGNNVDFSHWRIGRFAGEATLAATATGSSSAWASVFGPAYIPNGNNANFSDWQIGAVTDGNMCTAFGGNATLTATATGSSYSSWASVFGTAYLLNGNGTDFSGWQIGQFAGEAHLTAMALSPGFSMSSVFGAGWVTCGGSPTTPGTGSAKFFNWTIGGFGAHSTLSSFARDYSSIFGAGWATDSGIDFSGWTVGDFGAGATLYSSSFCSTIFGPARLNENANFQNWTIGNFGDGAILSTSSVNNGITGGNYLYHSYGSVFGSAFNEGAGTPTNWTVEFQGNATISSMGYNSGGQENVHLGTLGGGKNDDFRFYFNALQADNPVVTVSALKLSDIVDTTTPDVAMLTLSENQGTNNGEYARAIALGQNFQLNVGHTRTNASDASSGIATNGHPGTLNIFGAVSRAERCSSTAGSNILVNDQWTMNIYGPLEDVSSIKVRHGEINAYGPIKNITVADGTVNVYSRSDDIGSIVLNGGNLHIGQCADSGFEAAIEKLQNTMVYEEIKDGEKKVYSGSDGKIVLAASNYPWKGSTTNAQLTLAEGNVLKFHVDSSQPDPKIESIDSYDVFELAKGYITIEAGMENAIAFAGGKIEIVNDDAGNPGILPAHADFWLIRILGDTNIEDVGQTFGFDLEDVTRFEQKDSGLYRLTDDHEDEIFSKDTAPLEQKNSMFRSLVAEDILSRDINPYAQWNEVLDVFVFDNPSSYARGLFVGTGETPRYAILSEYAASHANVELALLVKESNTLVTDALSRRMANVKSRPAAPFIYALYGHSHQDKIAGFGYNNDMGGFVLGLDNVWTFSNERYLSLGAAFGYVHEKTNSFGSATGHGKPAKHEVYSLELFRAYESFNDKHLKANIGVTLRYCHGNDSLLRTDSDYNVFDGKIRSNSVFLGLEFVKNLYAYKGCQFGL
jgi:hypothetical protein